MRASKRKRDECYSGPRSKKFWARIGEIPFSEGGRELYDMGCILQEVEARILRAIRERERESGKGVSENGAE